MTITLYGASAMSIFLLYDIFFSSVLKILGCSKLALVKGSALIEKINNSALSGTFAPWILVSKD